MGLFDRFKALLEPFAGRSKLTQVYLPSYGVGTNVYAPDVPSTDALLQRVAGDVYSCVNLRATCVAEAAQPQLFVKKSSRGQQFKIKTAKLSRDLFRALKSDHPTQMRGAEDADEVLEHPLLDLLSNVNPFWNASDFFETWSIYSDTARFFCFIAKDALGTPRELWPLPPGPMRASMDREGLVAHWEYGYGLNQVRFETDEILLSRRVGPARDPLEMIFGYPPLRAVFQAADASNKLIGFLNQMLGNRGIPELIISVKGSNEARVNRLREILFDQWSGKNLGRNAVIGEEVKVDPVGWNPKDLQYIQAAEGIREFVCNAFNVPVQMFKSESVPKANLEGALYQLAKFCVAPQLKRMAETLNQNLVPMYDDSGALFLAFPNPVPEDKEYELQRVQVFTGGRAIMTQNEARAQQGLDPHPDGDELNPAVPDPFGGFGGDDDEPKPKSGRKAADGPGEKPKARGLKTVLQDIFRRQRIEVIGKLNAMRKSGRKDEHDPLSWSIWERVRPDGDIWKRVLVDETGDILDAQLRGGVRGGISQMQARGIDVNFDLEQTDALEFIKTRHRRLIERFATNVNETTAEELRSEFQEAIEAGETIAEIKKRVQEVYDHAESSRAEAIARTETKRALEAGRRSSYERAGVTKLQWIAGGNACPLCQTLDNKIVDVLGGTFAKMGDHIHGEAEVDGELVSRDFDVSEKFGDVEHPPLHPNCVVPDTKITAVAPIAGFKAHYRGEVLAIRLVNSQELIVTPNHQVLTTAGSVTASRLLCGQEVLTGRGEEQDAKTLFKQMASRPSYATDRKVTYPHDLHGDGEHVEGDILIAAPECLLADVARFAVAGYRTTVRANPGTLGLVPIKITEIVSMPYDGDVYDFQTMSRLYMADGIAVLNCTCFIVPIVE